MKINLLQMWHEMGWPVRAVVIVLTLQALGCITVAMDRAMLLVLASLRGRKFSRAVGPLVTKGDYAAVLAEARGTAGLPMARLVELALATFAKRREAGDDEARAAELTRRAVERRTETLGVELNRGMNVLASTGSTAPFVGLLGTVLGIINAFKLISQNGSGGIGTIGAAIGESLIVTGYGLVVAIPCVLLFNALSHRLDAHEASLGRTVHELLDRLEMGEWLRPGLGEARAPEPTEAREEGAAPSREAGRARSAAVA